MPIALSEPVTRNRDALIAIIASLLALLRGATRIDRDLHQDIMAILRPAESAVRRLIVIAAQGLTLKRTVSLPLSAAKREELQNRRSSSSHTPRFQLADPRVPLAAHVFEEPPPVPPRPESIFYTTGRGPRLTVIQPDDPTVLALWAAQRKPPPPPIVVDDGCVDATSILRRVEAISSALANIPHQAKRLARWKARRARIAATRFIYTKPLKPGPPPGTREPRHPVDHILADCHLLAFNAQFSDTS